jgi:hypothetical protein
VELLRETVPNLLLPAVMTCSSCIRLTRLRLLASFLFLLATATGSLPGAAAPEAEATLPQLLGVETVPLPEGTQRWVRSELYFSIAVIGREDRPSHADAYWQTFMNEEVTPRFPDGLTVFDAVGQWLAREDEPPPQLRTRVIVLLHPDVADAAERIDALIEAWKTETGQRSVLWVRQPALVRF